MHIRALNLNAFVWHSKQIIEIFILLFIRMFTFLISNSDGLSCFQRFQYYDYNEINDCLSHLLRNPLTYTKVLILVNQLILLK